MACIDEKSIPLLGIFSGISFVGHLLVIWTYMTVERLHSTGRLILMNLSASDILMAITILPLGILAKYADDDDMCITVKSFAEVILPTTFSTTIASVVFLNVDRYIACIRGFGLDMINKKTVLTGLALSWLVSLCCAGLFLLETPNKRETPFLRERLSGTVYFSTCLLFGLIIIIV